MSTATDIAALKARCLALEKKDTAIQSAATALAARVAKLEAVKPIDYATQIAALQKEVDALKYIISPTPAGESYYGPAPGTVYTDVGQTTIRNINNQVYDGYRYTGANLASDPENGVLHIDNASYNLTFRNCYIRSSTLAGGGNGVTIYDSGKGIYDITFDHCYFEGQGRMAFECISRRSSLGAGDYPGYLRVSVTNCYFAIGGAEQFSFDDDDPNRVYNGTDQGAGYVTVSGNYFEGCDGSWGSWPYVFELNRTAHATVTNNFFGPAPNFAMNTRCTVGDSHAANIDWVFSGNTLDATAVIPGHTYTTSDNDPQGKLWMCGNVTGGVTVSDTFIGPPPFKSAGNWGYFENCANLDFGGSTVHGYASATPSYVGGGTGFTLPTLV
jgi:hypothetical protein